MSVRDSRYGDLGLTVIRVVTGIVFFMHGWTKVFVWGFEGTSAGFAQMGIPLAGVMGPFVGLLELLGGLALVAGLATRYISVPLAVTMIVAILQVHLGAGFFNPNGYEFPLMLLAGLTGLALAGGGAFAVDNVLAARRGAATARTGRLATA
ncbi:DoxX family protein [Longimicrobium sp.]|uniref:DoxX family protein n=1 Tax=Longimicrobium sp. TaxID=2029185 RepID=UPI002E2F96C9|nr:DoxX family protein [Longimicrobium sp.]HEX6042723.1 DoxX family protein [Longimicrobium sp.]